MVDHAQNSVVRQRAQNGVLLTLAVLMAAAFMASPASAARYWNSRTTPLQATDDGDKKASGYGRWQIGTTIHGTRSQAYGYLRDDDANGKNVYFKLTTQTNSGYCIQPDFTQCNAEYFYYAEAFSDFDKETWNKDYWSPEFYTSTAVSDSGSYARAKMTVHESNGGPDTNSGATYTKGYAY